MLFSTSTWCTGETARACLASSRSSVSSSAKPPPVPPSVKAGRSTTGVADARGGLDAALQRLGGLAGEHRLAQALTQLLELLAILGQLYALHAGAQHLHAALGEDAELLQLHGEVQSGLAAYAGDDGVRGAHSGLMRATYSAVSGSMYTLSATLVSVMMVAGLELASTTS